MVEKTEASASSPVVFTPDTLFETYSHEMIGSYFSTALDTVYEGKSDSSEGYPVEHFVSLMTEKRFFPFLVFDRGIPVAGASWTRTGPKMDFGKAFVLPEYRGQNSPIRGKDLYAVADVWEQHTFGEKVVMSSAGFRIPESAAIAVNKQNWIPLWYAPLTSYGYIDEPLTGSGRTQEFIALCEKNIRGDAVPATVYSPTDEKTLELIRLLWQEHANRFYPEHSIDVVSVDQIHPNDENVFVPVRSSEERIRLTCQFDETPQFLDIDIATELAFQGNVMSSFPKTRIVFADVPADRPESVSIQNMLIQKGFLFAGVVPGVSGVSYTDVDGSIQEYFRSPVNVYAKLRPDVKAKLTAPAKLHCSNPVYDYCLDRIAQQWF